MRKAILLFLLLILVTGCAQNTLYDWKGYSDSLYKYHKAPSEETIKKHKETILTIIYKSNKQGKKIAPGICCEYGYYLLQEDKFYEAQEYFDMEMNLYPESITFINTLLNKVQVNKEIIE